MPLTLAIDAWTFRGDIERERSVNAMRHDLFFGIDLRMFGDQRERPATQRPRFGEPVTRGGEPGSIDNASAKYRAAASGFDDCSEKLSEVHVRRTVSRGLARSDASKAACAHSRRFSVAQAAPSRFCARACSGWLSVT